ncbi:AAA domain-containing protein [Jiangella sp. DSM 45060]|uniref:AAA domain-containing protein n=1 Tax=Jiangella sp. DSM 45060 TaxID=1798224 RepID=UPI00087A16BF|nr:AAA domain-containing protein [Jiangella sp. DSM 45060]SDT20765.1 AAA domain-containing protein [Jiangella sp. DSM 45060]
MGSPGNQPREPSMTPVGHTRDYTELVERLFCHDETSPFPGFERVAPVEVLVGGVLARARLERHSAQYDVTIFDRVEGFAGELWERSAHTLLRLRALDHPALPVIEASKQRPGEGIAFTITRSLGGLLDLNEAVNWAADRPLEAFEQFSLLLDALKRLHGARVMHRLMLPTALRWRNDGVAGPQLSLSRFEMSALISNLIRRVVTGDTGEIRWVTRKLYLDPAHHAALDSEAGARHLAYLAPEIHPFLFDENHRSRRDWESTDLFGLGVFGWELFCGGIPQQLPDELSAVAAARPGQRIRALADLHAAMRRKLRDSPDVPAELKAVLANMLAAEPDGRESSYDLAIMIERSWDVIRSAWEGRASRPYLVAFMPDESADTIYKERGWISRSPRDAAGRDELKAFYEQELQDAYLVHSLTGAEGYATGPSDVLHEAEWVLIGQRAVWFCAYLQDKGLDGSIRETLKDTLVIKYLREHIYAREIYTAQPRRKVPAIDLVAFFPQQSISDKRVDRPSWEPLATSVDRSHLRDPENERFLQSVDFLLDYQRAVLDARTYPYVVQDRRGALVDLRLDESRDDGWRQRGDGLMTAYARDPRRRPPLGDFLAGLDEGKGWTDLSLDGRLTSPGFSGSSNTVQYSRRLDENTVTVRAKPGVNVPDRGWVRPAEDSGSRPQLSRQLRARQALEGQPTLISELRHPRSIEIGQQDWDVDPEGKLHGNSPEVILAMLSQLPFYALQGPPGSGKTTAVANALKLFLANERGAKVLVSAQSNYALDNLAERLVKLLPETNIILRETSRRGEDSVSDAVQPYTLDNLSRSTYDKVVKSLQARLKQHAKGDPDREFGRRLTEAEQQISQEWLENVRSGQLELSERLRNGASVVLATCSVAADALSDSTDITESFDWVIVEEAAKAWPTELLVPLTLGMRWTLIGDHRQLGAHRSDDVENFLESLSQYSNEAKVKLHYVAKKDRLGVLNLFRSLFEPMTTAGTSDATVAEVLSDRTQGLGQLKMQFRMHPDIAEPVRRVFYRSNPARLDATGLWESFLESHVSARAPHGVTRPRYLLQRPLVWVDTGDSPGCQDQPMWSNEGEVAIIDDLVAQLRPDSAPPGDDGPDSLAVLTPYAKQLEMLQRRGNLTNRVFTVHSFQGREADRVIVSLVRTTRVADDPRQNVGHVGKDEVANVLLSRAKRLLVLVGRFDHFRDNGGQSWRDITSLVERFGTRVRAEEWSGS